MDNKKKDIVKMLLKKTLTDDDEQALLELLIDQPITEDIEKVDRKALSFGEKLADKFSAAVGSWAFIITFSLFLLTWIIINGLLMDKAPDPYPFILLNLVLSCVAAIQAPIIMMSQNRQAKKDALRNENDYRIDLKSELILESLHNNLAILIKNQNKIINYINSLEKDDEEEKDIIDFDNK